MASLAAVLYLGTLTMASGRWTRGQASFQPVLASAANVTYPVWADVGFWELCTCTPYHSEYFCSSQRSMARAEIAFNVLTTLIVVGNVVVFLLDAFILNGIAWMSITLAATYTVAATFTIVSLVLGLARFYSGCPEGTPFLRELSQSGARSLSQLGFTMHWAFGLRCCSAVALLALAVVFWLRKRGVVKGWAACFVASLTLPIFVIVTTASNYDIGTRSLSTTGSDNRSVGPWGACSCSEVSHSCPGLADKFRTVQAFAVLRLLFHCAQLVFVGLVAPLLGSTLPRWTSAALAWAAWVAQLVCWTVAVATFSSCSCQHLLPPTMSFDWPFGIDFIAFMLQTCIAGGLTWQCVRHRLVRWAEAQNAMAARQPPPTAEPIELSPRRLEVRRKARDATVQNAGL